MINGARQVGKSTLAQSIIKNRHPARYVTLDDAAVLSAVQQSPSGFLSGFDGALVLDEVQREPGLFLAIKAIVDKKRTPGRFLLTGSANVLLLPRIAESLAGRMEILTLWSFSQSELEEIQESAVDLLFAPSLAPRQPKVETKTRLIERMLAGGYPEVRQRGATERRTEWFRSYITTILQREVRDIANINGLTTLPRLLSLLAARATGLVNFSEIATASKLPQTSLKRYLSLLETTFLIHELPAWSVNMSKRLIKTPKLILTDTGIMGHLVGANDERLQESGVMFGQFLENFVVMELIKQITWSRTKPSIFYLRTATGLEVDVILESANGSVVGIEIKSSSSVSADDFKGLRFLANELGKRFIRGVLFYTGSEFIPFEKKLMALPVTMLWS